jgi:aminopeptidase N
VTTAGQTTAAASEIHIDANDNLTIDSVTMNDEPREFTHKKGLITLDFSNPLPAATAFTITVRYHGTPVISGSLGGGMFVSPHGPNNTIVMANLSEPFAAPTWWPCVDDPTDKATLEIEATVPEGFTVASNGTLEKTETSANGSVTYFWRSRYQTATYLVSVAATNYVKFEDSYTSLDGAKQLPIVYYVYPEHEARARENFASTRDAMEIFVGLFGEYPFLDEKYGMAEFPWRGAMEHQTISSMGETIVSTQSGFAKYVVAHELAHHWWGDWVTMKTWNDIWLNEGFATYAEVLFDEFYHDVSPANFMLEMDDGKVFGRLGGTVYAEDTSDPFDDTLAIYDKGAWVLHMLRRVMGDEKFFAALKDYGRRFASANASTEDFQQVCEQHYGSSLEWFFQQWIYAPGRPSYKVSFELGQPDPDGSSYDVTVTIKQKQTHQIPGRAASVYIMPLDIRFYYEDGSVDFQSRTIWNDSRKQSFKLKAFGKPVRVALDEDNWVLKKVK